MEANQWERMREREREWERMNERMREWMRREGPRERRRLEAELLYETAFQEALKKGSSKLKRARVMTVGASRVGKTSLLKRLIGERFDPQESSTVGVEHKICTSDVSEWRKKEEREILSSPTDELARVTRSMASTSTEESTLSYVAADLQMNVEDFTYEMKQHVLEMAQTGSKEKGMTYHLWDFGGQYVYYITHPIFLTWRAIYILVINLEKEYLTNMQEVHFWLKSIYTHAVDPRSLQNDHTHIAREPKILLVGTHADAVRDEVEEKMKAILENLKRTHYHHQISNYFGVDNANENDPKIQKVREAIDELMGEAPFMKESVPTRWVLFEDRIHELTVHDKIFYIKHSEALNELKGLGIKDDEAEAALMMFHHFGKIVYYNNIDLVVLDPQWLNGIMTKIITVVDEEQRKSAPEEWKRLEEQGVLTKKLINLVWNEYGNQKEALLSIMEKFDLICKIVVESTTDSPETSSKKKKRKRVKRKIPDSSSGEDCYFVPCHVEKGLRDREKKNSHGKFTFFIDFHGFVPVGFVHRLFVRIARWTMARGSHMPRFRKEEMTFFVDLRHQLEMKVVDGDEIQVSMMTVCSKPSPTIDPRVMNEFFDMLEENLEDLKEKWARRIKFTVGLKCTNCLKYGDTVTIPLRKFLEADVAVCKECDERLDSTPTQEAFGIRKSEDTSTSAASTSRYVSCLMGGLLLKVIRDGPVDDDKLEMLAKHVPHEGYTMFCNKLGIPYNEARSILKQFDKDYRGAIRQCLAKWKNRKEGMLSDLKKILIETELTDLIKHVE